MSARSGTYNLIDEINDVADEINQILTENQNDRYFEGMAILYSFIENVLAWLVFIQSLWNTTSEEQTVPAAEFDQLKRYCNQLNFSSLLNVGLAVGLLDYPLFRRIDDVRIERNHIVHQYWLYTHKGNRSVLRKKLEKLARIANALVEKLNSLVEETGMDDSYGLFEIRASRNLIP